MKISSGKTDGKSASVDQLLAQVQQLYTKELSTQLPTCEWWCVMWDYDNCCFEATSLCQQPDRGDPRKFKCPHVWPWVYIPNNPKRVANSPQEAVQWLNSKLRGQSALVGLETNNSQLADIVRKVGGVLIRNAPGMPHRGINPPPPPKLYPLKGQLIEREPATRTRSQSQRFTRTQSRGRQLADIASSNRQRNKSALRQAIQASRRYAPPASVPKVDSFVPGHRLRGETEDEFRERVGLETIADEILKAIGITEQKANSCQPSNTSSSPSWR